MTKLLEKAVEALRKLSPEEQDEIAHAILQLANKEESPEPIDPTHLPAVLKGLEQARRREFVSDADIEATFHRFET